MAEIRRVDIRAILNDPVKKREMCVNFIVAMQGHEGRPTDREMAEAAYDAVVKEAEDQESGWIQDLRDRTTEIKRALKNGDYGFTDPALKALEDLANEVFTDDPKCIRDGSDCMGRAKLRPSMTSYHWDGKGKDPNAPVLLCERHWIDHEEYWTERWNEYYSSR